MRDSVRAYVDDEMRARESTMDKLNALLLHRLQGFQSGKEVPDEAEDVSSKSMSSTGLATPAPTATVTRGGDYRPKSAHMCEVAPSMMATERLSPCCLTACVLGSRLKRRPLSATHT